MRAPIIMMTLSLTLPWTSPWVSPAPAVAEQLDPRLAGETLTSKVERRLREDDRITWRRLAVQADGKLITLYGLVRTPEERGWATDIAGMVPGVSAVSNRIIVDGDLPPKDPARKDDLDDSLRDRVLEGQTQLKQKQVLP